MKIQNCRKNDTKNVREIMNRYPYGGLIEMIRDKLKFEERSIELFTGSKKKKEIQKSFYCSILNF